MRLPPVVEDEHAAPVDDVGRGGEDVGDLAREHGVGQRGSPPGEPLGIGVAGADDRDVVAREVRGEHELGDLTEPDDADPDRSVGDGGARRARVDYWTEWASASRKRRAIPVSSLRATPGTSSSTPPNSR